MTLSKNWDLQIDPDIFKELKKVPEFDAKKILTIIEILPLNPYAGDIQKIKGVDNTWRRRIGSYRLLYKVKTDDSIILVFHLERRASKTY